jgi:glycosyltransferase involved in cell wall biosynthesis
MVTKNRLNLVKRSVRCFQSQSHVNRELIVVNDAQDGTLEYIHQMQDNRIRHIRPEREDMTLGELRNLAVARARGSFVMQWDDDDWYHPDRIKDQLSALLLMSSDICVLERWTLAWPDRHMFYWSKKRPWEGSMLAVKSKLPAYSHLRRGEDADLFRNCIDAGLKICSLDRPDLYVYVVHGANTLDRNHFAHCVFNDYTRKLENGDAQELLQRLGLSTRAVEGSAPADQAPAGNARNDPTPSVCVLIPVHNQAGYLYRAVTSALWQLQPQDEIIIVDDASNDVVDYAGLRPFLKRILWLSNSTQRGVSYSRNVGINASNAEWIKLLDADDILAPFALDIVRQKDLPIPFEVKIITGGAHRIHNSRYLDYLCATTGTIDNILRYLPTLPSATIIRRKALLEVGLFDERIDLEEDWEMWLRLHEAYGKDAFKIVRQPICYYWIDEAERREKRRTGTVEGMPIREYLRLRYGADPH